MVRLIPTEDSVGASHTSARSESATISMAKNNRLHLKIALSTKPVPKMKYG